MHRQIFYRNRDDSARWFVEPTIPDYYIRFYAKCSLLVYRSVSVNFNLPIFPIVLQSRSVAVICWSLSALSILPCHRQTRPSLNSCWSAIHVGLCATMNQHFFEIFFFNKHRWRISNYIVVHVDCNIQSSLNKIFNRVTIKTTIFYIRIQTTQ